MIGETRSVHYGSPDEKHHCYQCGALMKETTDERVVRKNSEEAQYYSYFQGPKFLRWMYFDLLYIHNVYYCPECDIYIEPLTQFSIEDLNKAVDETERHFRRKNLPLTIDIFYETSDGKIVKKVKGIENIANVRLHVFIEDKQIGTYQSPIQRYKFDHRAYYFNMEKRELIKYIESLLCNELKQ